MPESDARSVECPFGGVTSSGRAWRKGAGKRCPECGVPLQWRNQSWQSLEERNPESVARNVECLFSGVTNSGRAERNVPESEAWYVRFRTTRRFWLRVSGHTCGFRTARAPAVCPGR